MRRFELREGTSSKFWEIEVEAAAMTVRFGRIGTNGQVKTKSFASAAAAKAEHDKLIKENEDKLPADVKESVQADVDALKTALAGEDDDAVKTAFDKLNESQTKLGEAIYAQSQADAAAGADAAGDAPAGDASSDEDVIDAEVVDDEDEKK